MRTICKVRTQYLNTDEISSLKRDGFSCKKIMNNFIVYGLPEDFEALQNSSVIAFQKIANTFNEGFYYV